MHRREFINSGLKLCFIATASAVVGCDIDRHMLADTASSYPSKPITVIVPYAAGGSYDMTARIMEKFSMKYFGQPFITTNKPGGGATLGWNELAGSRPDGYTIGIVSNGVALQPLYGPTKYYYPTALVPLVQIAISPPAVVVLADSPMQTINDLVEYAKAHPGELKFAHPGIGTILHIVGELFACEGGITIIPVPFQGDSETLAALLGGHVQIIFALPPSIREYVKHGSIRVLALSATEKIADPEFKNVPTFKEQGYDIVLNMWWGIGAPKMLPKEVKTQLEMRLTGIINDPEFKMDMENVGLTVDYLEPDDFKKKWNEETIRLAKIVNDTGIAGKIVSQKN